PRSPEHSRHVEIGALAQELVGEPARAGRLLPVRVLEDVARVTVPTGGAVAVEVGPGPAEPLHDLAAHGGRDLASDARGLALAEGARAAALQPDGVGVGVGAVGHLRDLPEFSTAAPVVGADAQSHPLDQGPALDPLVLVTGHVSSSCQQKYSSSSSSSQSSSSSSSSTSSSAASSSKTTVQLS